MPLYKIETLSQMKMTYFIEAKELAHATDAVTMLDSGDPEDCFDEASQEFLGETIFSSQEVTRTDFDIWLHSQPTLKNCSYWMGDGLIHKIDYTGSDKKSHDVFKSTAIRMILDL